MKRDKVIARIRKLLALAATGGEEGKLAADMATRLRAEWGVEDAELDTSEEEGTTVTLEDNRFSEPWRIMLLKFLADSLKVKAVRYAKESPIRVVLLGTKGLCADLLHAFGDLERKIWRETSRAMAIQRGDFKPHRADSILNAMLDIAGDDDPLDDMFNELFGDDPDTKRTDVQRVQDFARGATMAVVERWKQRLEERAAKQGGEGFRLTWTPAAQMVQDPSVERITIPKIRIRSAYDRGYQAGLLIPLPRARKGKRGKRGKRPKVRRLPRLHADVICLRHGRTDCELCRPQPENSGGP